MSQHTASKYQVCCEITGADITVPTAMWTRPDTGDAPVSYPAPSFGAVKGIFESIVWLKSAEVVPTRVEIFAPLVFHTYSTNYGGPLRKSKIMQKGSSYQLLATVLINVCYRVYGVVEVDETADRRLSDAAKLQRSIARNGAHAYPYTASYFRPMVETRHAWYIEHTNTLGSCSDFALIAALTPKKKRDRDPNSPSNSWDDYDVPKKEDLPANLKTKVRAVRDLMNEV